MQFAFMAALAIFSMVSQMDAQEDQAVVNASRAQGELAVQKARVAQRNAEVGTQAVLQSINNRRRMDAAGKQHGAAQMNLTRAQDAYVRKGVESSVARAEALGAYTVMAASKGPQGGVSDIIGLTMAHRDSRAKAIEEKNQGYLDWEAIKLVAGVMPAGIMGQDARYASAAGDTSVLIPAMNPHRDWAGMLLQSGLGKQIGTAAADFFNSYSTPAVQQGVVTSPVYTPTATATTLPADPYPGLGTGTYDFFAGRDFQFLSQPQ